MQKNAIPLENLNRSYYFYFSTLTNLNSFIRVIYVPLPYFVTLVHLVKKLFFGHFFIELVDEPFLDVVGRKERKFLEVS